MLEQATHVSEMRLEYKILNSWFLVECYDNSCIITVMKSEFCGPKYRGLASSFVRVSVYEVFIIVIFALVIVLFIFD